ncbi:GNAT family N-acetyltransferase [Lentisphaerota bacterium ZTH]|nr:GNAT family N-acetyltransferase [Lentisphaerota bacterium]WET05452.1 GNAT family N-acetyltransferase [Lentisphaerota bacterium ZTH]
MSEIYNKPSLDGIAVRHFSPEDAIMLAAIAKRAFDTDCLSEEPDADTVPEGYSDPDWYRDLNTDKEQCMVILKDDKIVGGVVVSEEKQENWLERIFIDPEFQQMGIGSYAIDKVENDFYPESKVWKIDSPVNNRGPHEFYMKNGFIKEGLLDDNWLLFVKFKALNNNLKGDKSV